jgi:hypothetical protein
MQATLTLDGLGIFPESQALALKRNPRSQGSWGRITLIVVFKGNSAVAKLILVYLESFVHGLPMKIEYVVPDEIKTVEFCNSLWTKVSISAVGDTGPNLPAQFYPIFSGVPSRHT